jgi:hypothetical protein
VFTPRGSNIFGLHFASEEQRRRFYDLAVAEGFENESVCVYIIECMCLTAAQEENLVIEEKLEWEFDRIDGQRRVLGVGATAKVKLCMRSVLVGS